MKGKERKEIRFSFYIQWTVAQHVTLLSNKSSDFDLVVFITNWSQKKHHYSPDSWWAPLIRGPVSPEWGVWHRPGAPRSLVTTSTRSRARHESGTGSVADTAVGLFMVTSKHRLGWGGQFGVINLGSKYPHSCILEWLTVLKTFLLYHKSTFC